VTFGARYFFKTSLREEGYKVGVLSTFGTNNIQGHRRRPRKLGARYINVRAPPPKGGANSPRPSGLEQVRKVQGL
jgi:hypothetical protein